MDRPELLGTRLFDLSGRVAIVTGASRGLGRAIALALAAAGADVAISSRNAADLGPLCDEIGETGARAAAITAEITSETSCEALVEQTVARLGRLDILVNNAGINIRKPLLELTSAEYRQVLDTNLHGYVHCARAAGRVLTAQGSGKLINVSSVLGQVALANQSAYASAKGAVEQLTKVWALEWAAAGVQVNAIGPAYFETDLTKALREDEERSGFILERTPLGRWGKPHEVAGAAIFLASAASDYVTGTTVMVDGGWTAW